MQQIDVSAAAVAPGIAAHHKRMTAHVGPIWSAN
jgi:hypothetical protein